MMNDLSKDESSKTTVTDSDGKTVTYSSLPKVAVTSFVDTDTYENAGYLGRAMAEVLTMNWTDEVSAFLNISLQALFQLLKTVNMLFQEICERKLARQAIGRDILFAGTLTRNDSGIVVVGRVINMSTQTVVGSAYRLYSL